MSKQFVSSDYHLGHANIIKYCNRPFKDVFQMNETIIKRHNERVKPEDFFYFLGDFCFKNSNESRGEGAKTKAQEWNERLNGNKIFVKGNHDKNNSMQTIMTSCIINWAGKEYKLVHNPNEADPQYEVNFVGHVHQNWCYRRYGRTKLINVGVDCHSFYPKTFDELLNELKKYEKNNKLEEYQPYYREEKNENI